MTDAKSPQPDASTLELATALLAEVRENGALARWLRGAVHLHPDTTPTALAADILHGAAEIALFLYGDEKHRKKVYRLIESGKLPHFRLGANICSRRSVLRQWIERQEEQ